MTHNPLAASPLPVEITNQTDWWQPYVPPLVGLIGSILVALVALYSVRKSNKTNERAIEAADNRDRESWRRDNLLRICSEATRVAREILHHYSEAAAVSLVLENPEDFDQAFRKHMAAAQNAIGKVAPLSYDMALLGEHELYMEFQEVRQVGEFIAPAIRQFHEYLVTNLTRIQAAYDEGGAAPEAINNEIHKALAYRRYYKAKSHMSHALLDFQFAAQRKISPQSLPENAPPGRLDPVITPEKHPDIFYPPIDAPQNIYQRPSPFDWDAGDTADDNEPPNSSAAQTD